MSLFRPTVLRSNLFAASRPLCLRSVALRHSSTSKAEPVVLPRLPSDLKDALRAKNKPTLTTIRALQAEIINASKTNRPINTDAKLYVLILKQIKAANTAIEEFRAAKRNDLVDKEQAQLEALQKYADEIPKVSDAELDEAVKEALETLEGKEKNVGFSGAVMGLVMERYKGQAFDTLRLKQRISEIVGTAK